LRKSIDDDAKNTVLREKSLVEEIKSLKSQLAAKEKERIETVEALHNMESWCISVGAKLEAKIEDYDNLKKELEKIVREKNYIEKKSSEKDQNFHNKCNRLWELCKNCYDKFGAKPEDPCWDLEEFDLFFAWLCRQYKDLPTVIQTSANLSCIYATRALFHLMKVAKDLLYEQMLNKDYKFHSVEQLSQVTSRTQLLCKKYFNQYWNMGGRENAFFEGEEKDGEGWIKNFIDSSLFLLLYTCIYFLYLYFVFCFFAAA
jgi:hypothetical protein